MRLHLYQRAAALALASLLTAAMLAAIDRLAGLEDASPQWAAAVAAKRA